MSVDTYRLPSIAADASVASPGGIDIFESNIGLQEFVARFCAAPEDAVHFVTERNFLGQGRYSDLCIVGGVAVKLSTPNTGREAHTRRVKTLTEDLFAQHDFMSEIDFWLRGRPENGVIVPQQYFAIRKGKGYLQAMQLMSGFEHFKKWLGRRGENLENWHDTHAVVHRRIVAAFVGSNLLESMSDIYEPERERDHPNELHTKNIMMQVGDLDPETATICIIDQETNYPTVRGLAAILPSIRRSRRRNLVTSQSN